MPEPEDPLKPHFDAVVKAMFERRIIPFLGAGASLCDRNESEWDISQNEVLPNSEELTNHLARMYSYPSKEPMDLPRVSQYVAVTQGVGPLYEALQGIFDRDYRPTSLHEFFAGLPAFFREKNLNNSLNPARQRLVIVTTNYDDLMEQAFEAVNEPYHKLVYMADPTGYPALPGSLLHWTPDEELFLIEVANEYRGLEECDRPETQEWYPVIVKIHGAVDRSSAPDPDDLNSSYVITEDHYIDFLTRTDVSNLLPKSVVAALKRNNFLFLGYSLRDWNLRVILRRIWKEQKLSYNSWAVQLKTGFLDDLYWNQRGVNMISMDVGEYLRNLKRYMDEYNGGS